MLLSRCWAHYVPAKQLCYRPIRQALELIFLSFLIKMVEIVGYISQTCMVVGFYRKLHAYCSNKHEHWIFKLVVMWTRRVFMLSDQSAFSGVTLMSIAILNGMLSFECIYFDAFRLKTNFEINILKFFALALWCLLAAWLLFHAIFLLINYFKGNH